MERWPFFKVVIWRDRNEPPGAIGFVLSQRDLIENLPEEVIDPGRFSIRQKRISQIERDLDISFGPVTEWDQMPQRGADESLDEEGIEITHVSDILVRSDRSTSTGVAGTMAASARNEALSETITGPERAGTSSTPQSADIQAGFPPIIPESSYRMAAYSVPDWLRGETETRLLYLHLDDQRGRPMNDGEFDYWPVRLGIADDVADVTLTSIEVNSQKALDQVRKAMAGTPLSSIVPTLVATSSSQEHHSSSR